VDFRLILACGEIAAAAPAGASGKPVPAPSRLDAVRAFLLDMAGE
jgi:hypothetical protein